MSRAALPETVAELRAGYEQNEANGYERLSVWAVADDHLIRRAIGVVVIHDRTMIADGIAPKGCP